VIDGRDRSGGVALTGGSIGRQMALIMGDGPSPAPAPPSQIVGEVVALEAQQGAPESSRLRIAPVKKPRHRADGVLNGGTGVDPALAVQVNMLNTQPLHTTLARGLITLRTFQSLW